MTDSQFVDTLRMSQRELDALLKSINDAGQGQAGAANRVSRRWELRPQRAVITLLDEGGSKTNVIAAPRNISSGGLSFLHGGFLHPGTRCVATLKANDGEVRSLTGRIVRCVHRRKRIHEVGVAFDREIRPRDYQIELGDGPQFSVERVDPRRLKGRVLLALSSEAERDLIKLLFEGSPLEFRDAPTPEAFREAPLEAMSMLLLDEGLGPGAEWHELVFDALNRGCVAPCVVLTTDPSPRRRLEAIARGAREVVVRPVSRATALRAAAEYLLDPNAAPEGEAPDAGVEPEIPADLFETYKAELRAGADAVRAAAEGDDPKAVRAALLDLGPASSFGADSVTGALRQALDIATPGAPIDDARAAARAVLAACAMALEAPAPSAGAEGSGGSTSAAA